MLVLEPHEKERVSAACASGENDSGGTVAADMGHHGDSLELDRQNAEIVGAALDPPPESLAVTGGVAGAEKAGVGSSGGAEATLFESLYQDVFLELEHFGEILDMIVCENQSDHLRGNVYVLFSREEEASRAASALTGRSFAGRPVLPELCPVADFGDAVCRRFVHAQCKFGGACDFLHPKGISQRLHLELFETASPRYLDGRSREPQVSVSATVADRDERRSAVPRDRKSRQDRFIGRNQATARIALSEREQNRQRSRQRSHDRSRSRSRERAVRRPERQAPPMQQRPSSFKIEVGSTARKVIRVPPPNEVEKNIADNGLEDPVALLRQAVLASRRD